MLTGRKQLTLRLGVETGDPSLGDPTLFTCEEREDVRKPETRDPQKERGVSTRLE